MIFHWFQRPPTQLVRVPPIKFEYFRRTLFFWQNEIILQGKTKLVILKVNFLQHARTYVCTDIRKYVAGRGIYAPPTPWGK